MKKGTLLILANILFFGLFAQVPNGYYDSAEGLSGEDLREALHQIIKGHTSKDYNSLHSHFENTDKKSNGKVWDMYSDNPGGTPSYEYSFTSSDQCGNYAAEGDCYNREHSFPQSWFDSQSPMKSDLFHVYPTDGYVNGRRSNHPYGNVGTASWTSSNGSKLGSSATSGYSGTVFEPIDEYKGDFARTYFYMLTRYKDIASGWTSDMLTGDNFKTWAINLLLEWDENDPVSQKEIDRNDAVYGIQNNRNPYIDNVDYAGYVWGGETPSSILDDYNLKYNISYVNTTLDIIGLEIESHRVIICSLQGKNIFSNDFYSSTYTKEIILEKGIYIINIDGVGAKLLVY